MSQQQLVSSFFKARKRPATDDVLSSKAKVLLMDKTFNPLNVDTQTGDELHRIVLQASPIKSDTPKETVSRPKAKAIRSSTRASGVRKRSERLKESATPKTICTFLKKGPLTPRKSVTPKKSSSTPPKSKETTPLKQADSKSVINQATNNEVLFKTPVKEVFKTPTKELHPSKTVGDRGLKLPSSQNLSLEDIKKKLKAHPQLNDLKNRLNRITKITEKYEEKKATNIALKANSTVTSESASPKLKEFKTIDMDILTSPRKGFKTPTKQKIEIPELKGKSNDVLMSPKSSARKTLFSPLKQSPAKTELPAYQRFKYLTEVPRTDYLQLPYKYRSLFDIFKAIDQVCAVHFNRKETITFKKLQSGVQQMIRKAFHKTHLAQIEHLYPGAFSFVQMKMRNYGSLSKQDYFQLVIIPNVETISETVIPVKTDAKEAAQNRDQLSKMNPISMTRRLEKMKNILFGLVKDEHDKFLKSLTPPMNIDKDKITRWHPEFDLESCPDIACAALPEAPNMEKFSTAQDILTTARNLFNCRTEAERSMQRYEEHLKTESPSSSSNSVESNNSKPSAIKDPMASVLKNVPKSLLEKIRAKQAAKAFDIMTRQPAKDLEAQKYQRLPELARHLRNIFVTEGKGVLTLEFVLKQLDNSYRVSLSHSQLEEHLKLIATVLPTWLSLPIVSKVNYVKLARTVDLNIIKLKLDKLATAKAL